jgi:hypothetical protein
MKHCSSLAIFEVKFLQYISCHSTILKDPRLNFAYVVQLFLLYKMVKKKFRKKCDFWVKRLALLANFIVFDGFSIKNQTFSVIVTAMTEIYSKVDTLFGISAKNRIE